MSHVPRHARRAACLACALLLAAPGVPRAGSASRPGTAPAASAADAHERERLLRLAHASDAAGVVLDATGGAPDAATRTKLDSLAAHFVRPERHRAGYAALDVAQRRLESILARREFALARSRSPLERWIDSVVAAIDRWLARWFHPFGHAPGTGEVLAWVVLGITLAVLARALVLAVGPSRGGGGRAGPAAASAPEDSARWFERARSAAARGAFREAVHHAYWAAAHRLSESGALAFDPSRTHRETLRRAPIAAAVREPLERLVTRYERVWYGGAAADDAAWDEARRGLEELGCRSGSSAANASS